MALRTTIKSSPMTSCRRVVWQEPQGDERAIPAAVACLKDDNAGVRPAACFEASIARRSSCSSARAAADAAEGSEEAEAAKLQSL